MKPVPNVVVEIGEARGRRSAKNSVVTISRKSNEPAPFNCTVLKIVKSVVILPLGDRSIVAEY